MSKIDFDPRVKEQPYPYQRGWRLQGYMVTMLMVGVLMSLEYSSGSSSENDDSPPPSGVAFVVTTDFSSGSYSTVNLDTRDTVNDIVFDGIHRDVGVVRFFNGLLYVVNRLGQDTVQLIDPQQGFTTPNGAQLPVGENANPHDIAFVSSEKAYVSRYNQTELWIINPTALTQVDQIDLRFQVQPLDLDGVPEMSHMLMHNDKLYLALQHLDRNVAFTPLAPGDLVVINPSTDAIERVIPLPVSNPFSELQFTTALPFGPRILVSAVGRFGVIDGGIVAIDPITQTADAVFVLSESIVGGEITHFAVVSATQGFAIVSNINTGVNTLVSFDPTTGRLGPALFGPLHTFMSHFAINSRGELYLAVTDTTTSNPGLHLFDSNQGLMLSPSPLNVGTLPPAYVLFIE